MRLPCTPLEIKAQTTPPRDILAEVLPTTMTYKDEDDVSVDFRERTLAQLHALYDSRRIAYYNVDRWVRIVKTKFSPEAMNSLGKGHAIYSLNRELDVDYSNYETTTTSQLEELPDTPIGANEYLSQRGTTITRMVQPSGPMGSAMLLKDSILAIYSPLEHYLYELERYFINDDLIRDECPCGDY